MTRYLLLIPLLLAACDNHTSGESRFDAGDEQAGFELYSLMDAAPDAGCGLEDDAGADAL